MGDAKTLLRLAAGLREAAIEIVVLWFSIAISIFLFSRHSKLAAGLLIPYLLWVTFATALNLTIWSMNTAS